MHTEEKQCEHPLCPCPADPGSEYCSAACQALNNASHITCPCGHELCRQAQRTRYRPGEQDGVSGSLDPRMRQEDQEKPLLDDWGKGDKH